MFNKLRTWQGGFGVSEHHGIVSPAYFVCRPGAGVVPRYLHYLLRARPYLVELTRLSKWQPPSQFDIPWDGLRRLEVLVPPIDEQQRIINFLDASSARAQRLSDLRQAQKSLVSEQAQAELDAHVDALFQQGQVPLKRFARGVEQGASPQCESRPAEEGEWGVLKLSAVKGGVFNSRENKAMPSAVAPVTQYRVREGDLLVTRANTPQLVGDVAVATDVQARLQLCDLIYRVRLTPATSAEFVAAVLLSSRLRGLISSVARGSSASMIKLRGEDILNLPMPSVDRRSQERLASEALEVRAHRRVLQDAFSHFVDLLAERREALITAVVTGQLDVTTARGAA